jgi:hypothetical protein
MRAAGSGQRRTHARDQRLRAVLQASELGPLEVERLGLGEDELAGRERRGRSERDPEQDGGRASSGERHRSSVPVLLPGKSRAFLRSGWRPFRVNDMDPEGRP